MVYETCLNDKDAFELATGLLKMAGANIAEAVALESMIPQGRA
jgi:hypothetical protein